MGVHRTLELTSPLSNQWGQWNKSCYPHFTDEETETQKDGVKKKSRNIGKERSSFQIQHLLLLHYSTLQRHLFLLLTELHRLTCHPKGELGREGASCQGARGRGELRTKRSMGRGDSELGHQCGSSGAETDYVEETWKKKTQSDSAQWAVFCVLYIPRDFCAEICHIHSFQSLQPTLALETASLRLLRALIIEWCLLLIFASIYAPAYKWYG